MTTFGGILFVVALLFSIGLHELGHLATAKRFGMKVHQYFIGFGPKLWSTVRGETEYGVKALPFGGFVKIAGMNPYEEVPPEDADRVFGAKRPWQRAIVLAAGSFTHFVLGFVILAIVFSATPKLEPTTKIDVVTEEFEGAPSPAAVAGLREGDRVLKVDGVAVESWDELIAELTARPGETIPIRVAREGERLTLTATLADHRPNKTERVGYLGIGPVYRDIDVGVLASLGEAGRDTVKSMWLSLESLGRIFTPSGLSALFSGERPIEGATTVVGLTGQAAGFAGSGDFATFFLLIAAFNIFIGVANLLPLPPLDGGHLAVLAYEKVTRREVDVRKLIPITVTVITVFGALFLILLLRDIADPIVLPR